MKQIKLGLFGFLILLSVLKSFAQGVAVNTDGSNADNSAMLDVSSNNKGMLVPRVSIADLNTGTPVSTPAVSLLVYNTNVATGVGYYYWDGSKWVRLTIADDLDYVDGNGVATRIAFWSDANTLTSDANLYWDDANNRLGIRTSSPTTPLYLDASAHNGTAMIVDRYASGGVASIQAGPSNEYLMLEGQGTTGRVGVNFYSSGDVSIVNGGGNLGVGTNSATAQLHTTGSVRFANYSNGFLQVDGSGNLSTGTGSDLFTAGDGLVWSGTTLNSLWKENGSDIYNGNTGNVGVGTTNPSTKLHISSLGWDNQLLIERTDGNPSVTLMDNNAETAQISMVSGNLGLRGEGTSVTETFIIEKNTGNVGVGVADPTADLHVSGGTGSVNVIVEADTDNNAETDNPTLEFSQDGDIVHGYIGLNGDTDAKFSGAISNGMYLQTDPSRTDALQLATAGNARLTVAGDGNVGIGTTNPTTQLHVMSSGGGDLFSVSAYAYSPAVAIIGTENNAPGVGFFELYEHTNTTPTIRITASTSTDSYFDAGNVGFGTTTPDNLLDVNGKLSITQSAGDEMVIINDDVWQHGYGNQDFGDGGDHFLMASKETAYESAGIYGDGDHVTIWSPGDGAPGQSSALLYILDEDFFSGSNTDPFDNSALKAYVSTSGVWTTSDRDKKQNIAIIDKSLQKISEVNGYAFEYKINQVEKDKGQVPEKSYGIIAQELENVLPNAVQTNQNGDKFVNYSAITPLLIEGIKEQQKTIELLLERLEELEEKLEDLEN
jgi:hypothetical protein